MVGGSYVMAVLGRPRNTDDLDVLVEPTKANAKRLSAAFADVGYPELAKTATTHFAEPERMATLGRPPVAIDILTSFASVTFQQAWRGRLEVPLDGVVIPFLGLREFVRCKRAVGRTKDLLDIALLEEGGVLEQLGDDES